MQENNIIYKMDPETEVPPDMICPITQMAMTDPVITVDGHTFERKAITEWFNRGNITNPLTGAPLDSKMLIPNIALKGVIEEYNRRRTNKPSP
jgi:hypothetical protein